MIQKVDKMRFEQNQFVICLVYYITLQNLTVNLALAQICQIQTEMVQPDMPNTRLNKTVFKVFDYYGSSFCFDECIRRPRCISLNYDIDNFRCELSEEGDSEFVDDVSFNYYLVKQYRGVSI